MKETEFEKQQLEQLISDLKDIDKYTSFKNGAFIYDLGKYQGSLLVNEIERLNNIINTFEDDLEREVNISEQESMVGNYRNTVIYSTLEKMLKYFRELKESGTNE